MLTSGQHVSIEAINAAPSSGVHVSILGITPSHFSFHEVEYMSTDLDGTNVFCK